MSNISLQHDYKYRQGTQQGGSRLEVYFVNRDEIIVKVFCKVTDSSKPVFEYRLRNKYINKTSANGSCIKLKIF